MQPDLVTFYNIPPWNTGFIQGGHKFRWKNSRTFKHVFKTYFSDVGILTVIA